MRGASEIVGLIIASVESLILNITTGRSLEHLSHEHLYSRTKTRTQSHRSSQIRCC